MKQLSFCAWLKAKDLSYINLLYANTFTSTIKMLSATQLKISRKLRQFSIDYSVDVSHCFDEKSEEGNLLLDFFFHVRTAEEQSPRKNSRKRCMI